MGPSACEHTCVLGDRFPARARVAGWQVPSCLPAPVWNKQEGAGGRRSQCSGESRLEACLLLSHPTLLPTWAGPEGGNTWAATGVRASPPVARGARACTGAPFLPPECGLSCGPCGSVARQAQRLQGCLASACPFALLHSALPLPPAPPRPETAEPAESRGGCAPPWPHGSAALWAAGKGCWRRATLAGGSGRLHLGEEEDLSTQSRSASRVALQEGARWRRKRVRPCFDQGQTILAASLCEEMAH